MGGIKKERGGESETSILRFIARFLRRPDGPKHVGEKEEETEGGIGKGVMQQNTRAARARKKGHQ